MDDEVEVFDSPDLHVKFAPGKSEAPAVFATFTPRNGGRPNKKGFGEAFFAKRGIPALHFVAQRNHWWQVADLAAAISAAEPFLSKFSQVITYGASMGAHGALVHSKALRATRAVALSPQFAINGRATPWLPAWSRDTATVKEAFRMEEGLSPTADVFVVYDPLDAFDVDHVRKIESIRPVTKVPVSFAGHSTAEALLNAGQLGQLVMSMLGEQPARKITRGYRLGRRRQLAPLLRGRSLCLKAGKPGLADRLGLRIRGLVEEQLDGDIHHPSDLLRALHLGGRYWTAEERLERVARLVARYPELSDARMLQARLLRDAGDLSGALWASSLARRLAKKDFRILLYRALIRAELGDLEAAEKDIQFCLNARSPARVKEWQALVQLYRRAGISAATMSQVDQFVTDLASGQI